MDTSTGEYRAFYARMKNVCHVLVAFARYDYGKLNEREERKVWLALATLGWHLPFAKGCTRESFGAVWRRAEEVAPLLSDEERRACRIAALDLARGGGSKPIPADRLARIEAMFGSQER